MRLIISIIILTFAIVTCVADRSKHERIMKHKEWLNQRKLERKLIGYVETDDPYQKIKYFKKLIKFRNKEDQTTSNNNVENLTIPNNDKSSIDIHFDKHNYNKSHTNDVETTTNNAQQVISKFAYETLMNESLEKKYEDDGDGNSSMKSVSLKHKAINEGNKKQEQKSSVEEVFTSKKHTSIEKENFGNKINHNEENINIKEITTTPTDGVDSKKTETNTVHSETLNNDLETQKFLYDHVKYKSNNITLKKMWGKYSPWSSCSRTCGKGIMSQSRNCMLKMYKDGKRINVTTVPLKECIGFYKRFRICNEHDCPSTDDDFRAQQCSEFNAKSFKGLTYEWEPFVKEDAECELNCRPKNQKYFARLKEHVIDGTPCTKVLKNQMSYEYAVCVEGKCKAVLKNGIISGSGFVNSGNVRCGNSICKPISTIFAKNPLPNGYVHVSTIPTGSSNVTITEMLNNINLLVLKTSDSKFVINGNYTASPSGKYLAAGTVFEYHKVEGNSGESRSDGVTEWITSIGPLLETIHVMVLSQDTNPGIKIEYLLPQELSSSNEITDSDYSSAEDIPYNSKLKAANYQANNSSTNPRKRRKLAWRVVGFTQCSKSCGGGTNQPIYRCTRGESTKAYSPKKCSHLQKPKVNENLMKCNTQPCPAYWKLGEWSACNCGESNEKSDQTREVKCVQELISGVIIQVNSGACDEKPTHSRSCNCSTTSRPPLVDVYKKIPSILTQFNTQNDQKISTNKQKIQKPQKSKKSGVWLTSDWSDTCEPCGGGQQYRTIFCDRTSPHNERCDIRQTPITYRECNGVADANEKCFGEWFIGPWSVCEGDCFSNSSKTRTVVCIKDNGFAEESECDLKNKPETFKDCTAEELKDCGPKWHISEWTECSKSCGNGMQKRIIRCLEVDRIGKTLRESKNCKYSTRPQVFRHCNTESCSGDEERESTSLSPSVEIQSDQGQCRDEFLNCHIVLNSNLCGYQYYNENCCKSCRMNSNELY